MRIRVLFFGMLKDMAGRASDVIDLPEGARLQELVDHYERQIPQIRQWMPVLALSVNQQYASRQHILHAGDAVALLPPVSGGSGADDTMADLRSAVRLVREPIQTEAVLEMTKLPQDGAAVVFEGVVRDNTRNRRTLYLEYEAYEAMALQQLRQLAEAAQTRFAVRRVAIVHRLGRLQVGETSVLIVAASSHRGPAFEACRWVIDTLKKTVPIWKKEHFEDGAVWADGEPFPVEIRQPDPAAGPEPASK